MTNGPRFAISENGKLGNQSFGQEYIKNTFVYHKPNEEQQARFNRLTDLIIALAEEIDVLCPESREKSLAMTKLQECRMFSNAAIALNPEKLK